MQSSRLISLGVIGAPQGVKGELRVKSYTQTPKAIARYGALTDKSGKLRFAILSVRPLKDDMLVIRLEGIGTREAAQALNGVELFARRDQLPAPAADEFYQDDLIGLDAIADDGAVLGRVVALANYGAGDILEIALAAGGESLLLPFARDVVLAIDFDARRIMIALPLEIDGEPPAR